MTHHVAAATGTGRWAAAFLLVASTLLAGCGGGDQLASGGIVGTGDAGVVSVGTISTLAADSITVNGRRFTTAGAVIRLAGQPGAAAALKIGMVVTVQGGATQPDGSVAATTIDYRPEVQGVVSGVDGAGRAFVVLGQRVRTDAQTAFDGGTFDTLLGQYVEVSGFRSSPGELLATYVAIRPTATAGAPLEVTGTVAQLDPAAKTFVLGAQLVDYAQTPAALVPAGLANGAAVRARGTVVGAGDRLLATEILLVAPLPGTESAKVELEGVVTGFVSLGNFRVQGQVVDARAATFEGGAAASLGDGARVEVEGRLSAGVVVATTVSIEAEADLTIDGLAQSVDVAGGSVTVGGQRILTTASTQYEDRSTAALRDFGLPSIAVGDRLSIRATQAGTSVVATRIQRLDRSAPGDGQGPDASAEGVISNFVSVASFSVGERKVDARSATFVGGVAGDLANGKRVAVTGVLSDDRLLATTVTFEAVDPGTPSLTVVEGAISGFVTTGNFVVAGQRVDARGAIYIGGGAADLANGVRVKATGTIGGDVLAAAKIEIEAPPTPTSVTVEGSISGFVSAANFKVAGQTVDATKATIKNGVLSDLANGRRCKATGPVVGGVVAATVVTLEDTGTEDAEAEGRVANFVSASNFTVGGRVIDASAATFSHGTAAKLANGVKVEVHGKLVAKVLKAGTVAFDD